MIVIHKYQLPNGPAVQTLQIPTGGRILKLEAQQNFPMMWVLVDTLQPNEARMFEVVQTGQQFSPGSMDYIGTAQLNGGSYVLHFWEVRKR